VVSLPSSKPYGVSSVATSGKTYPASLLPALREIGFVCPLCRGELDIENETYRCPPCQKVYPLLAGIPDFRIFPDPYLDFQEDEARTRMVLAALDSHHLESLLEYYWSFSDVTPEALRPKFIRSAMLGEQKSKRTLQILQADKQAGKAQKVLEIGSGTGNFLVIGVQQYKQVIGIDIAMRWLHVSRRRFMDKGLPVPPLVCCCAEHLPFADGAFDLAVMSATLEFAHDQAKVLSECVRVLNDSGMLYINTVNRYAMARDPYAYLWGVGLLPRQWQARYVRWRRGASYENIHLLSYSELRRMAAAHFSTVELLLPQVDDATLEQFSRSTRMQAQLYNRLKDMPLGKALLRRIGPGWDAKLRKSFLQVANERSGEPGG